MNPEDILDFLKKGKDDQELMLMCQAAMEELGPQGFMDAIKPAADDALQWYEDKLDTVEGAYVQMVGTVPDRVVRIGLLAGSILDSKLEKIDLATSVAILIDRLVGDL